MKTKFFKSGRIGDTEIIISCETNISSQIASIEVNDLVKAAALKLAKDIRDVAAEIRTREKSKEKTEKEVEQQKIPVMESLGKMLGAQADEV